MIYQLLSGLFWTGGTFAAVIWAGLYIEARWIGLPGRKGWAHELDED